MRLTMGALLVGLVALSGCHARFKKHASELGEVRLQVLTTTGPSVALGFLDLPETGDPNGDATASVIEGVVNAAQTVKSAQLSRELASKVSPHGVNRVFEHAVWDAMSAGPPFRITNNPNAPLLQVEVHDYGLAVPALGAPGEFHYSLRAQIYNASGKRVYNNWLSCSTIMSGSSPALVVNNAAQLRRMPRMVVQQLFEGTAEVCGHELTRQVRQHAG